MTRFILVLCALAAVACVGGTTGRQTEPGATVAPGSVVADTLRGIIAVVGAEPGTSVVLELAHGGVVTLIGERPILDRLAGLEVMVEGARDAHARFGVRHVTVRASAGVPAVDGTLAREGERYVLVTADARRLPIAVLPEALRGDVGARVWLAGPLDRAPDTFGVIAPPP